MGDYGNLPSTDSSFGPLRDEILRIKERLRDLERPSGTAIGSLVDQVQTQLASIDARVSTAIAANSYTKAQIDSKVASPGAISPTSVSASGSVAAGGNVSASGQVISAGILNSPGTKANTVTVGYSAVYIDSAGNLGGNTSSRRFKTNITELDVDLDALLALQGVRFQRHTDVLEMGEAAPWQSGFLAEDVAEVLPLNVWHDEDGRVEGVRYEEMVVPIIMALAREHKARIDAEDRYTDLSKRVAALEGKTA